MVEYKTIIPYSEAQTFSADQKNASPIPVVNESTVSPSPKTPSIIVCKAEVGFSPERDLENEIAGFPSPIHTECIMSPNPNCKDCKVAKLERKIKDKPKFVSKKEFKKRGAGVFLARARINMEPPTWQ